MKRALSPMGLFGEQLKRSKLDTLNTFGFPIFVYLKYCCGQAHP